MTKRRVYTLSPPRSRTELIAQFEAMRLTASGGYTDGFAINQEDRDKAAKSGAAMPDGSYPIVGCDGDNSVDTAIKAVGRGSGGHDAIRKHIMSRAKTLGCSAKIPDNWNADGSLTAAGDPVVAEPSPADKKVSQGAAALQDAIALLQKEQLADPDDATDPADTKVTDLINQLDATANELVKAQAADVAAPPEKNAQTDDKVDDIEAPAKGAPETDDITGKPTDDGEPCPDCKGSGKNDDGTDCPTCAGSGKIISAHPAKPAPTMNPATVAGAFAVDKTKPTPDGPINPVDEDGNVDPDATCATNGCGDLASVHADTDTGQNTGACSRPGCECPEMTFASNNPAVQVSGDDEAPGEEPAGPTDASKLAAIFPPAVAPAPQVVVPDLPVMVPADSKVNEAPFVQGSDVMGPAFLIPCGIILGQETDDGRGLGKDSLSWLNFPLPLMGQATSTHDPNGMDTNTPAVLCGRIDSVEITPGENGTQLVSAKGFFLSDDDGMYYANKIDEMGRMGISADVKVFDSVIMPGEVDDFGFPTGDGVQEIVTQGELAGFTIVTPSPAFPQCYIMLDDGETTEKPIPVQADDPMTASAQLVHFMTVDKTPCIPCGEMDVIEQAEAIVAAGQFVDAPMRPPMSWFEAPNFQAGDGRVVEIFTGKGANRLGGKYACPLTITDEGEVFGHIAPWDVCHTGYKGKCVTAPHSNLAYSQFMRVGQQVKTAEGALVRVGVLTFDTGHADLSGTLAARNVQRHYDDTGTAWADVVAGEDEHGIWIHGALRPNLTELQLRQIRASSPSGDWREVEGGLELMAILQVNQPGFPVAMVAGGSTKVLIAAGAMTMSIAAQVDEAFDDSEGGAWERIARRLLPLAANHAQTRLDALQNEVAESYLARLDAL